MILMEIGLRNDIYNKISTETFDFQKIIDIYNKIRLNIRFDDSK